MRNLLLAAALLLVGASPAQALNCIVVVYYEPTGDPLTDTDLVIHKVDWADVAMLRNERDVLTIFINHDNPLGNEATTTVTGHEEFSLQHIGPSTLNAREGIVVSSYDNSPKLGTKRTFRESRSISESVRLTEVTAPLGSERAVLAGADVAFISLNFSDPAYDDAQARSLNVDRACPVP